jgi:hypothetical protein
MLIIISQQNARSKPWVSSLRASHERGCPGFRSAPSGDRNAMRIAGEDKAAAPVVLKGPRESFGAQSVQGPPATTQQPEQRDRSVSDAQSSELQRRS